MLYLCTSMFGAHWHVSVIFLYFEKAIQRRKGECYDLTLRRKDSDWPSCKHIHFPALFFHIFGKGVQWWMDIWEFIILHNIIIFRCILNTRECHLIFKMFWICSTALFIEYNSDFNLLLGILCDSNDYIWSVTSPTISCGNTAAGNMLYSIGSAAFTDGAMSYLDWYGLPRWMTWLMDKSLGTMNDVGFNYGTLINLKKKKTFLLVIDFFHFKSQ